MPDYTDDSDLLAECLQAEATYGTLLPCEQFATRAGHRPDMTGAAGAPVARPGPECLSGGN